MPLPQLLIPEPGYLCDWQQHSTPLMPSLSPHPAAAHSECLEAYLIGGTYVVFQTLGTRDYIANRVFVGTWMAQLVKHPTLDFGSGHDSSIVISHPAQCGACLRLSLSFSLCPPHFPSQKKKVKSFVFQPLQYRKMQ